MTTFVVPPLRGPTTGGTHFNRGLYDALAELGHTPELMSMREALQAAEQPAARKMWIDSLWLAKLPELARRASASCRVGLLTHYLPTLVSHGERPPRSSFSAEEEAAIAHAAGFLVPSEYLAGELRALGIERSRVRVLEPGVELPRAPNPPRDLEFGSARVVVVANVTEGKGILPLLLALAEALRPNDELELFVFGSLQMDRAYAERCVALVACHAALRTRVHLRGSCPYAECIEAISRADLMLSASRMESYGMALAEARACGRPILARRGGNVAAHVDPRWGRPASLGVVLP